MEPVLEFTENDLSRHTQESGPAPKEPVHVEVSMLPSINYAMQQNGIRAIRSIAIENTLPTPLEHVDLTITAAPEFALPLTRHIDYLPAEEKILLSNPDLILNGEYLAGLTERVTGSLHIQLKQGQDVLFSDHAQIGVLAFDTWHGLGMYPELLTAFITPNHPDLARLIVRATQFLGEWTGDTSMDSYQSRDPNRVLAQAAAIFAAIKEEGITYAVAPASFERVGQRVRLVDMVLQQKLGTCLDLTLLYAACLEAVGLHPLLIATVGHIFTGVWLEEKMFPECVQDDCALITKRLASGVNEIAVVETTCVTTGRDSSFDHARSVGEQNLSTQKVEYIIDVHRARMSYILPLPQRVPTASGWKISHPEPLQKENQAAPRKLDETIHVSTEVQEAALPKKAQWERKLLDLGLRNALINLRITKTQLPILTSSLDALEDALADGSDLTILPRPADWKMEEFSFEKVNELGSAGIIQAEFENKRLRSALTEGVLANSIKELYRTAKTALEENGANTLYLAMGMLRWYESKRSTKPRYAPIVLIPIEMVRKSAAQGYVIRLRDEEPQMNITLLEKLKQDFGMVVQGLDPLPMDDHGIDMRKVLTILRKAVMEQPHWDVLETACVGIFSFSQFVMWNDIRNRSEDLMQNKVVRSLMEGRLCWDAQPLEIGQKVDEDGVLLPMQADASQLHAIRAACGGNSFVLHGPPGTGKSQTITSLIANALANGKRVLFVAEKMAALEVVQKRLERIGIGPFCLELHSNKSKKKDVLEQLRKASEVTKAATAEEYEAKAERIGKMRRELDSYTQALHRPLPCGSDLYTLIDEYECYKHAPDLPPFSLDFIRGLTKQSLEEQQLALERVIAAAREIGHPHNHPLTAVGCDCYTQSLRTRLPATVRAYEAQIGEMQKQVGELTEGLGEKLPEDFAQLQKLYHISQQMARWQQMPRAWAKAASPQMYFDQVAALAQHSLQAEKLENQLLEQFDKAFLSLDGAALLAAFAENEEKWFLPKLVGKNKLLRKVKAYARSPIDPDSIRGHLANLRDYQQEKTAAGTLLQSYGQDLEELYHGPGTDWNQITSLAREAQSSAQALYDLLGSYQLMQEHCAQPELREAISGVCETFDGFVQAKEEFETLLNIAPQTQEDWLDGQRNLCATILEHGEELKEWAAYVAAAAQVEELGLGNVIDSYRQGADHRDIYPSCKKAVLYGLICDGIDESEELNQFSGTVFNQKIQQYKRMDQEWTRLSQQEVFCRLASKIPNFTTEAAQSSELGILQRCIKSGGRGTSIRKLFDQIPNLLPRLCPCMLMSPISAAQYLDPKWEPFDIVVFDEASQLPTCKAVGVLARGRDAVIVGDPKQMPPTSFFATNVVDEENLEAEDLESILDDCLALNMPQSHLLWHYRSRHESLIAFSNSQFYENKLLTFPSVNDRESKVRLVRVDGIFDRGKTRTNQAEAQAVVAEIQRRYQDPELSKQSIGVVTFNISQQHLIDDLLTERCAKDPDLEKWAYSQEEPLFIKNLENVQGDERDVILFSIGFGPDENGKIYMNFGPLNREGGWRRLNVAVSRARCEMVVFSTIEADQLDLNRTKAEGVAALRSFLEYAQGKRLALAESAIAPRQGQTAGIPEAICKMLKEAGYETDLAVGRSAYRVDIGVVDPKNPDRYLLGILLDGDGYGSAKTTRDREIGQIDVLRGLGWNILRVWSMDWWDNSEKEKKRILEALNKMGQEGQASPPPAKPPIPVEEPVRLERNLAPKLEAASPSAPPYQAAALPEKLLSAEAFVQPGYARTIQQRIRLVIQQEAPVSLSVLTKRVVQSCGISRAGSRIQSYLMGMLQKMRLKTTAQGEMTFFWRSEQNPETYVGFRVQGDGDNKRDIRDVPVQEIANAMYVVLYQQISMNQEDLLRETASMLGYTRLGNHVIAALTVAIAYAQQQGGILTGSNGAFLLSEEGTARGEAAMKSFS